MSKICIVLILVDSFFRYPQRDKMAVFCYSIKIIQFCFINPSISKVQVLGRSSLNRNKLMRRSFILFQRVAAVKVAILILLRYKIFELMPLSNLPFEVFVYNNFSIPVLSLPLIDEPRLAYAS